MNNRKIFILLAFVLIFVSAGIGSYLFFKKPTTSVHKQEASFVINTTDLLLEFEMDESTANQKYLDKVIEVKGKVESVKQEGNEIIVYLKDEDAVSGVMCSFSMEAEEYKNISENTIVSIKGICNGYLLDVVLKKCSLVKD